MLRGGRPGIECRLRGFQLLAKLDVLGILDRAAPPRGGVLHVLLVGAVRSNSTWYCFHGRREMLSSQIAQTAPTISNATIRTNSALKDLLSSVGSSPSRPAIYLPNSVFIRRRRTSARPRSPARTPACQSRRAQFRLPIPRSLGHADVQCETHVGEAQGLENFGKKEHPGAPSDVNPGSDQDVLDIERMAQRHLDEHAQSWR